MSRLFALLYGYAPSSSKRFSTFSLILLLGAFLTLQNWQSAPAEAQSEADLARQISNRAAIPANNLPKAVVPVSTADGNWVWQNPLPSGVSLYGISCPTANLCFAVGASSSILRTQDAGQSWTPMSAPPNSPYNFVSVNCPNSTTCFAVSEGFNNATVAAYNGNSWFNQPLPTATRLYSVACLSPTSCFAGGDGVIATYNGSGWSIQNAPSSSRIESMSCPGPNNCFAVGGNSILIYNGSTWNLQPSPVSQYLTNITCLSATACFVLGTDHTILFYNGSTWNLQYTGTFNNIYGSGIACIALNKCFAFDNAGTVMSYNGTTWNEQPNTIPASNRGMTCTSAGRCIVVNVLGGVTIYDGNTWKDLSPVPLTTLYSISCASSTNCITVGGNGLIAAYNGTTWVTQNSGTTAYLYGVSCPAVNTCFAVGESGTILAYNGTSWTAQASPTTNSFHGISCPSVTVCFVAGGYSGGTIVAYNGSTWTVQIQGTIGFLLAISCPAVNTCFAAGTNGTVVAYNGSTWTNQTSNTTTVLNGISCPTVTKCFAVGGENSPRPIPPYIMVIGYDGTSWSTQYSLANNPFNLSLEGIACPSPVACYTVGSNVTGLYYNGSTWDTQPLNIPGGMSISCATPDFCIIVGSSSKILARALVVSGNSDNGTGQPGTLSAALSKAVPGQTINFKPASGNTINITGKLPDVPAGVVLNGGGCGAAAITLNWQGSATDANGLVLNGNDTLYGLKLTHFPLNQLKVTHNKNQLACVSLSK